MALVVPVIWTIVQHDDAAAVVLIFVAGLSDVLDGLLAKRMHWTTTFGAAFDPLADKVFMGGSFIAAVWAALIPVWIAVIVVARDTIIVAGALMYRWRFGSFKPQPSVLSKVNTGLQIILLLVVLASQKKGDGRHAVVMALMLAVTVTTFASGLDYWVRRGRGLARATTGK